MMSIGRILRVARGIVHQQRQGSDYDELYFGLQDVIEMLEELNVTSSSRSHSTRISSPKIRRKRTRSPVQKLLDDMAGKAWKQYKRAFPNGKKSYMDIRSRISRSQEYKKKAKRLKK